MSEEKHSVIPVSELGEFALIDRLTKDFKIKNDSTVKGVGDDSAVIGFDKSNRMVVSTDMLVEGINFNLMYVPLRHLGFKTVIVGISDIVAMNATPRQITVSVAISAKFSVEALDEFYSGVYLACDKYGIDLVGGDTTSSMTGFTISVTAIGEASEGELIYRNGAKKNDLICVTGDLGGAYMGLNLLERENEVFKVNPKMQPQLSGYHYIIGRQLKPEARTDMKSIFSELKVTPTAMIDISDGLASEVMHICKASGLGAKIYEEKIPIDGETKRMAIEMNINPLVAALNGGEDYELLFTVAIADHDKIRNHPDITVIGHIVDANEGCGIVTTGGSEIELTAQGWNNNNE